MNAPKTPPAAPLVRFCTVRGCLSRPSVRIGGYGSVCPLHGEILGAGKPRQAPQEKRHSRRSFLAKSALIAIVNYAMATSLFLVSNTLFGSSPIQTALTSLTISFLVPFQSFLTIKAYNQLKAKGLIP